MMTAAPTITPPAPPRPETVARWANKSRLQTAALAILAERYGTELHRQRAAALADACARAREEASSGTGVTAGMDDLLALCRLQRNLARQLHAAAGHWQSVPVGDRPEV